jgi:GT2 family glycosyltransferase
LDVVLYDDGSTDGTSEAVRAIQDLTIHIISGDGSAFWAKSMSVAETFALERQTPKTDILLWLNDDVELDADAIVRLLSSGLENADAILIGSVRDPDSGIPTYSGYRSRGVHPLRLAIVQPGVQSIRLDTFHGNVVWIPVAVAKSLGGIDGEYAHAMADIDYGFRAADHGVAALLCAGTFGTCSSNLPTLVGGLASQWSTFISRKGGGDFASMKRILRKRSRIWWVFMSYSYGAWWAKAILRRSRAFIGKDASRG